MKKLLVLALVLSIATMANAALTLTISGPTSVVTNSVTTYTIGYSLGGFNGLVSADMDIVSSVGSIGGGAAITTNRDTVIDIIGINSSTGNYEISLTNDNLGTDLTSPLATFQFTAPSVTGLASVQLLENSFFDLNWNAITGSDLSLPTLSVHVIPEPMTLSILGLGGLFLRRRK